MASRARTMTIELPHDVASDVYGRIANLVWQAVDAHDLPGACVLLDRDGLAAAQHQWDRAAPWGPANGRSGGATPP